MSGTREPIASAAKEWREHEHVTPSVQLEAKKLVEAAGSPEIAKRAVEAVADAAAEPTLENQQLKLAKSLGFLGYRPLVEASTPARQLADQQWYITSLSADSWALWNDRDLGVHGVFKSTEDAAAAIC